MKKILTLIALSVAVCSMPTPGSAQAERGEGAHAQPEETTFQLIARGANFVVLFGGLAYLLRKPMTEFFQTRRNEIASGLQRAQDAQDTAQARMDQIDQRLAQLTAAIAALRGEAQKESRADREKVLVEAKREVERVIEQSREEINRVARTVERQIKENIADLLIDRAGKTLRTEMTQDDENRVVFRFIKKL